MSTSPFFIKPIPLQVWMLKVCLALLPGIVVYVLTFGVGVLVQIALATLAALCTEAICLKLRHVPIKPFITDGSAVLTAWLLALSIPPLSPWWMIVLGTFIAIALAKQLYGGLGQNPFNPAMIGFAVLIISFPAHMSKWSGPLSCLPSHIDGFTQVLLIFTDYSSVHMDAIASATPLDLVRTQLSQHLKIPEILNTSVLSQITEQRWINLAYLAGGLYLLLKRMIPWQIPFTFLSVFILIAGVFHLTDPSYFASPWFHLGSGATMLGAFFILTDPITAPTTVMGRCIFAAMIGLLVYVIRVFGGYPDGIAFAVIIANMAVPFIDQYTQPAVFGHTAQKKDPS